MKTITPFISFVFLAGIATVASIPTWLSKQELFNSQMPNDQNQSTPSVKSNVPFSDLQSLVTSQQPYLAVSNDHSIPPIPEYSGPQRLAAGNIDQFTSPTTGTTHQQPFVSADVSQPAVPQFQNSGNQPFVEREASLSIGQQASVANSSGQFLSSSTMDISQQETFTANVRGQITLHPPQEIRPEQLSVDAKDIFRSASPSQDDRLQELRFVTESKLVSVTALPQDFVLEETSVPRIIDQSTSMSNNNGQQQPQSVGNSDQSLLQLPTRNGRDQSSPLGITDYHTSQSPTDISKPSSVTGVSGPSIILQPISSSQQTSLTGSSNDSTFLPFSESNQQMYTSEGSGQFTFTSPKDSSPQQYVSGAIQSTFATTTQNSREQLSLIKDGSDFSTSTPPNSNSQQPLVADESGLSTFTTTVVSSQPPFNTGGSGFDTFPTQSPNTQTSLFITGDYDYSSTTAQNSDSQQQFADGENGGQSALPRRKQGSHLFSSFIQAIKGQ